jgi:hypothetical protein
MKTPHSEKHKDLDKDGKAKKKVDQTASAKGGATPVPMIPGFGMAALTLRADGTSIARIPCINGDPNRNTTNDLPEGILYFNSRESVPVPSEISIYLPDGANIDINAIFPWAPGQADPLRLGGGIIKGILTEGAQRTTGGARSPLQAPIVVTDWVNGTAWRVTFFLSNTFGLTLYEGDAVFGLAIVDPVTHTLVMRTMAKAEGTCHGTIV